MGVVVLQTSVVKLLWGIIPFDAKVVHLICLLMIRVEEEFDLRQSVSVYALCPTRWVSHRDDIRSDVCMEKRKCSVSQRRIFEWNESRGGRGCEDIRGHKRT
jgi:hypothetical protein